MTETPNLHIPYIAGNQAQPEVTHNEALRALDAVVALAVLDRDLSSPPGSSANGQRWIVGADPSGDWAGHAGDVAAWQDDAWAFYAPGAGWLAYVLDEAALVVFADDAWSVLEVPVGPLQEIALFGLGTTAEESAPFAAKLNAALWTAKYAAEGGTGDLRSVLNKEAAGDTASVLLQRGYSGRAEIGLLGDDDLTLKVSPNGSDWTEALRIDKDDGTSKVVDGSAAAPGLTVGASGNGLFRRNGRLHVAVGGADLFRFTPSGLRGAGVHRSPNVVLRNYLAGAAWIASSSAADNGWLGIAWSPDLGLFAAVANSGSGNRVMTSPNGIAWTARSSPADNNWTNVAWSTELGLFAAIAASGSGNRIMTSSDGIAWTLRSSPADYAWRRIVWAAELGLFIAVANDGQSDGVMTSPDGVAWTLRSAASANAWQSVAWSPELGLAVAVASSGSGNRVMTSPDGVTWTSRTSAADNDWRNVAWAPELGLFVAVASSGSGNRVMTSPDGVAWTIRSSAADNDWRGLAWCPEIGLLVAVGATGSGNRVMTSPDGLAWTARTSAADNQWFDVAWAAELGLLAAAATTGTGNRVMTSVSVHAYPYRS